MAMEQPGDIVWYDWSISLRQINQQVLAKIYFCSLQHLLEVKGYSFFGLKIVFQVHNPNLVLMHLSITEIWPHILFGGFSIKFIGQLQPYCLT